MLLTRVKSMHIVQQEKKVKRKESMIISEASNCNQVRQGAHVNLVVIYISLAHFSISFSSTYITIICQK